MKKNMSSIDGMIRFLTAAVFVILYFTNTVTGVFGYVLLAVAGILVLTSFISFCPLYLLFGISSCKTKSK